MIPASDRLVVLTLAGAESEIRLGANRQLWSATLLKVMSPLTRQIKFTAARLDQAWSLDERQRLIPPPACDWIL